MPPSLPQDSNPFLTAVLPQLLTRNTNKLSLNLLSHLISNSSLKLIPMSCCFRKTHKDREAPKEAKESPREGPKEAREGPKEAREGPKEGQEGQEKGSIFIFNS
jgi:hypothetical protein